MTRLGQRPSPGSPRRRWPGAIAATSLLLTVIVWVADGSEAQTDLPFDVDVSKITDLVNGETIEINVRTSPGTTIYPGAESEVRTCRSQTADYSPAQFDNVGGDMCVVNRASLSEVDESVDNDFLHRFPDNGPEAGRRAIAILRPGQGTAHWQQGGEHELTCDQEHPCQLVSDIHLQTGTGAPRPSSTPDPTSCWASGPTPASPGAPGPPPGPSSRACPTGCRTPGSPGRARLPGGRRPAAHRRLLRDRGEGARTFAAGTVTSPTAGSATDPASIRRRSGRWCRCRSALNAVVVAVGGGYTGRVDGTWPIDLPATATSSSG